MAAGQLLSSVSSAAAASALSMGPYAEQAAIAIQLAQSLASRCSNPSCTPSMLVREVGGTTCAHLIDSLLRNRSRAFTAAGACLEIASLHPLECGSCAPLGTSASAVFSAAGLAPKAYDHVENHADTPPEAAAAVTTGDQQRVDEIAVRHTHVGSEIKRRLAGQMEISVRVATQLARCTDDPDYMDAGSGAIAWQCSDWIGYDCRPGGYGIETAESIERLVYSCPESCRDVQPYCVPHSPLPLMPNPPYRPMLSAQVQISSPVSPLCPSLAAVAASSPPPPRFPRCTDDAEYRDAGSGDVAWQCSDWVGFDCRLGGFGIETAEGIGLLVYSCPE
eukprot:1335440-Pleurochrysis_carterae.AAC.1